MDEDTQIDEQRISRRDSIVRVGGFLATTLVAGGAGVALYEDASAAGAGPAAVASGAVSCVLTPELTEGPYYIAKEKVRRNITEERPGLPLALRLEVVNVSTCKPIKGAAVDIWHCDAAGIYSGIQAQNTVGKTFMRGIQSTDAKGIAAFETVYPGWYTGRAVHIHVKVHVGGKVVHTGQLFFPDALTDAVYEKAPYSTRPAGNTRNSDDSIFVNGGKKSLLRLHKHGAGYRATITIGVQRA